MANADFGNVPHGVLISDAIDVTVADLTIRDVYYHPVQVQGEAGATGARLYNLHLIDAGEQFVKGSTGDGAGPHADDGLVACSRLEYTDRARSDYTNGVDVLAAANWIIRDNIFVRIRAPVGQLAGPAVLMWRNSLDTVVERNLFVDCDRAIALGLSPPDPARQRDGERTYDHQGGIIRNNMIYRARAGRDGRRGHHRQLRARLPDRPQHRHPEQAPTRRRPSSTAFGRLIGRDPLQPHRRADSAARRRERRRCRATSPTPRQRGSSTPWPATCTCAPARRRPSTARSPGDVADDFDGQRARPAARRTSVPTRRVAKVSTPQRPCRQPPWSLRLPPPRRNHLRRPPAQRRRQ